MVDVNVKPVHRLPVPSPSPSKHLFTDASLEGWGAHLDFQEVSGSWGPPQSSWYIHRLEVEIVLVATDNVTVVAYINKQGCTRSPSLSAGKRLAHVVSFQVYHSPGTPYSRSTECPSGPGVEKGPNPTCGMVSVSSGLSIHHQALGFSNGGPVRHQMETL